MTAAARGARRRVAGPAVVVGTTLVLLAVALAGVVTSGRDIGLAEDWTMVPAMTGAEPDLLGWLWSQNNEHRLPAQRLLYLGLLRATGDFRSGMVASQLLLAATALTLAAAAARARGGGLRATDALFPLALLHLGHWENLVWGWQIQFVWSVFLAGLLLALVASTTGRIGRAASLGAGVVLALLPISGANGIVVAAAMAFWAGALGLAHLGAAGLGASGPPRSRATAAICLGGGLLAYLMIALYFVGYVRPPWSPALAGPDAFLAAARTYFAYAFGPGGQRLEPVRAAVALAVISGGGLLALRALLRGPADERPRALGIVLFVGSTTALGLAIALARGGYPGRMPDRYALFAALPLVGAALAWTLYAPARLGRVVVAGLVVAFLVLLPLNVKAGLRWRAWYVDGMARVEADLAAGVDVPELAERHRQFLMHWSEERLRAGMAMLRDAGVGPFAAAPRPPPAAAK